MKGLSMLKRLLFITAMLTLFLPMPSAWAQWSEPTIGPVMMTAPLTPPPVTGTTFYVDKNSIGGTCNNANAGTSISAPWCTIGKATATLTAGQRAYIRAATYNEGNLFPANSGTAGNYITLERYPGDAMPVINCTGATWCFDGFSSGSKSYWVINGFELHSPNQQWMVCWATVNCHHWWFVNGKYHDSGHGFAGFDFGVGTHHMVLSNNEIYNSDVSPVFLTGQVGFDSIAEFNVMYNNGRDHDDEGAIKCGGGSWGCVLRYNTIYENWRDPSSTRPCFNNNPCKGISGLYIDQGCDLDGGATLPGCPNANAGRSYIYNNIVYNNDIGIEVFDSPNVTVFNNLVYNNGSVPNGGAKPSATWGIGLTIESTNKIGNQVYNNTVYNNANMGLNFDSTPATGLITRNNIFMNNNSVKLRDSGVQVMSNSGAANVNFNYDLIVGANPQLIRYNNTNYASLAAFQARGGNTTWLNAVATAATFVGAAGGDFHQASGSSSVNAGATVSAFSYALENTSRPQGGAWDIGAYERILSTGPVAYYPLDQASGTNAPDASGSNHPGTLCNSATCPSASGPAWIAGHTGSGALQFDGTSDWVSVAAHADFNITADLTIAAWVKRAATGAIDVILAKTDRSTVWDYDFFICGVSAGNCAGHANQLAFLGDFLTPAVVWSTTTLTDTANWHHVAFVKSGTSYTFYLDGVAVGSGTFTQATMQANSVSLAIGDDTTADYFGGLMDELYLYNASRTEAEILALVGDLSAPLAPTNLHVVVP